jgi:CheY-like chemotaxis protein
VHILLVEDHDDTRMVLSKLLDHCGHDVSPAASLREALDLLATFRFDGLVSDIGLPDGDGFEVVTQARKQQRDLRITVAVTAFGSAADRERGREAGFDCYMTKPFDFAALRGVLASAA